ncbi:hypothetical protein GGI17_006672, partial [Coemansia sp. S146]
MTRCWAKPAPEVVNPFPPSHVVLLVIKNLGLSLADPTAQTDYFAQANPLPTTWILTSSRVSNGG